MPALLLFATGLGAVAFELAAVRLVTAEFGSTVQASAAVVAVFLGALASGALVVGRLTDRAADPRRWFSVLVVAGGVAVLLSPWLVASLAGVALDLLPLGSIGQRLPALLVVALAAVLIPGFALGGTLPALVGDQRARLRRGAPGLLYAANTFGSVAGVGLAAYLLLEQVGARGTAMLAGALLVATGALSFLWRSGAPSVQASPEDPASSAATAGIIGPLAAAVAGFATLATEVLATRLLMQYLPSSAYSFAAVLGVFLLGTAGGAAFGSWLATRRDPRGTIGPLLALMGLAVTLVAPMILTGASVLELGMVRSIPGQIAMAATLLPATLVSGALFAVLVATYGAPSRAASHVGRVTAFNTAGSVAGALLAGFWLIPTLGVGHSLSLAGVIALVTALFAPRGRLLYGSVTIGAVVNAATWLSFDPRALPSDQEPLYYAEGPVANTIVIERDGEDRPILFLNRTAPQGGGDGLRVEQRQALVPLALRETLPSRALVLGVGTGATLAALVDGGVRTIDAVDLVSDVFEIGAMFDPRRRNPAEMPGVTTFVGDAVGYVRQTTQSYDLILSDLYHPWMDGAGALYSVEHFRAVRRRLTPDGMFCQWVPLHQLRWEDFGLLCRTFTRAFPQAKLMLLEPRSALPIVGLIGPNAPLRLDPMELDRRLADSREGFYFRQVGLDSASDVLSLYLGDQLTIDAVFGGEKALGDAGLINTIDRPVIEYRAARTAESEGVLALNNMNNVAVELGGSVGDLLVMDESLDVDTRTNYELALRRRGSALKQYLAGHYLALRSTLGVDDRHELEDRELALYARGLAYDPDFELLRQNALRIAKVRFLAGRYTSAATACQAILELAPEFADAQRCLGLSMMMLFEFEAATAWLEKAAAADADAALLSELGIAQYLNGDDDAARASLDRAAQLNRLRVSQLAASVADALRGDAEQAIARIEPLVGNAQWGTLARRARERFEEAR